MKTPILTATFTDGSVLRRQSLRRYTHAWKTIVPYFPFDNATGTYSTEWKLWTHSGFALSRENAAKAALARIPHLHSRRWSKPTKQERQRIAKLQALYREHGSHEIVEVS